MNGNLTIKATAANLSAYLHELRNAYGHGATLADVLTNPQKATTAAEIFEAVEELNENIKNRCKK